MRTLSGAATGEAAGTVPGEVAGEVAGRPAVDPGRVEILPGRVAQVGTVPVRRTLPTRGRRTVGAWCFVDHMGPTTVDSGPGFGVPPHPHMGLQTVTWLFAGTGLHRDSLGSEQVVRPGQLSLMTAGSGIAHSEEDPDGPAGPAGELHGMQLWVAQPSSTRHGSPAFEHHGELPQVEVGHGTATVFVGEFAGAASPARRDTDHLGVDLDLRPGTTVLPLLPGHEYAVVVADGHPLVSGAPVGPGGLAYLRPGSDELELTCAAPARALLIGGAPFDEELAMWWNFVARTREELADAYRDWAAGDERFGPVASALDRAVVGPPPWLRAG